jgi:GNAT superfamily N-acetyltransferase
MLQVPLDPSSWEGSPHITDSGILDWWCWQFRQRAPTTRELAEFAAAFEAVLTQACRSDPRRFAATPGAAQFLELIREAGWDVAIATGWRRSRGSGEATSARRCDCRRRRLLGRFRRASLAGAIHSARAGRIVSMTPMIVRRIEARDETQWRELWDGYVRFYEHEPSEAVTRHTWARIMDASPVHGIVVEHGNAGVIGMANYVIHENTWTLTPVCYLEDLFVDPHQRAAGAGRQLIDWLVAEMKSHGWGRLYWHTRENNYRARGLYDKYTPHSGFVRYVISP